MGIMMKVQLTVREIHYKSRDLEMSEDDFNRLTDMDDDELSEALGEGYLSSDKHIDSAYYEDGDIYISAITTH